MRRGQRRAPVTRIACYGCGGPHRMRHCTQTSENMRVRIWALLRRRDMEQPSAGIGGDASDQEEDMPSLIPDPAPAEQKQEAELAVFSGGTEEDAGQDLVFDVLLDAMT